MILPQSAILTPFPVHYITRAENLSLPQNKKASIWQCCYEADFLKSSLHQKSASHQNSALHQTLPHIKSQPHI